MRNVKKDDDFEMKRKFFLLCEDHGYVPLLLAMCLGF